MLVIEDYFVQIEDVNFVPVFQFCLFASKNKIKKNKHFFTPFDWMEQITTVLTSYTVNTRYYVNFSKNKQNNDTLRLKMYGDQN